MLEKNLGQKIRVPHLEETALTLNPAFRAAVAEIDRKAYERVNLNEALKRPYNPSPYQ